MVNKLSTLADILSLLAARDVTCSISGGWAEELLGLRPPWQHSDIDLVHEGADFIRLDRILDDLTDVLHPVPAKRFPHKRAFIFHDTLCEIILVDHDGNGPVSYYWGDVAYRWECPLLEPEAVSIEGRAFSIVSKANLVKYRSDRKLRQPNRWRDISNGGP